MQPLTVNQLAGIWWTLHTQAIRATNGEAKNAFIINVRNMADQFPCQKCKPHLVAWIEEHSFDRYWLIKDGSGRDVGFFKWTWELHNDVNRRITEENPKSTKVQIPFDEAYNFYLQTNQCSECINPLATATDEVVSVKSIRPTVTVEMMTAEGNPIITKRSIGQNDFANPRSNSRK